MVGYVGNATDKHPAFLERLTFLVSYSTPDRVTSLSPESWSAFDLRLVVLRGMNGPKVVRYRRYNDTINTEGTGQPKPSVNAIVAHDNHRHDRNGTGLDQWSTPGTATERITLFRAKARLDSTG